MPLNKALIGKEYQSPGTFVVGREHVRRFAVAVGDESPASGDADAASALGHPDVVAPPTFLTTLVQRFGRTGPIADPELGMDYSRVVHGDQSFMLHHPITAGAELRTITKIKDIRAAGANELVIEECAVLDQDGRQVATMTSTVVSRGTAMADGR